MMRGFCKLLWMACLAGLVPASMLLAADLPVLDEAAGLDIELQADDQAAELDEPLAEAPLVAPSAGGSFSEAWVFYAVALLVGGSALGCVISVNIVRMASFLFASLGSVAILYFLLGANFLGAIQLIVYAGGTLIVIIFGVMLTSSSPWARFVPKPAELAVGAVACLVLLVGLGAMLAGAQWPGAASTPAGGPHSVADFGMELLTTYLVPFELASVLLLAVMIGAAYLARPRKREGDSA